MRLGLIYILRVVLAAVFIYAGYSKLSQPWLLFAMAIDAYGLLPHWAVLALARSLPWYEVTVGVLLLTGLWLRTVAMIASALLAVFFGVMLRSYAKGLQIDCACFGLGEAISLNTLLRDGVLVLSSVTLTVLEHRRARVSVRPT